MSKFNLTATEKTIEGLDQFAVLHNAALQIKESLTAITIADDTEMEAANQLVSKAKSLKKQLENKRKEFTEPLDSKKKIIMSFEKRLVLPINEGIDYGSNQITAYYQKKEAERKAELEALQKKQADVDRARNTLSKCEATAYDNIERAKNVYDLQQVFNAVVKNSDGVAALQLFEADESFSTLWDEIANTAKRIRSFGKIKKEALLAGNVGDTEAIRTKLESEKASEAAVTINPDEIARTSQLKTLEKSKGKGVRRKVKYRAPDMKVLDDKWCYRVADSIKIQDYIKEHGDKMELPDTTSIPGIEFFEEFTHVAN